MGLLTPKRKSVATAVGPTGAPLTHPNGRPIRVEDNRAHRAWLTARLDAHALPGDLPAGTTVLMDGRPYMVWDGEDWAPPKEA